MQHSDIITTTTTTAMNSEYQQQQQQQQQQQRRSRKRRQLLVFEQQQQQLQDTNNRLRIINNNNGNVNDDLGDLEDSSATSTSAICDLAGLVPFVTSTFPLLYGYEMALAMELAIQHLNTRPNNNDSIIIPELLAASAAKSNYCPIQFSAIYIDTKRNPSTSFAEVDFLTRTTVTTEYDYLMNVSSSSFDLRPDTTTERQPSSSSSSSNRRVGSSSLSSSRNNVLLPCAIVGAHDSKSSKTTALVSGMRGFPQISPASTSDSLDNRAQYPLFGRTMPSDRFATEIFIKYLHDVLHVRHIYVIFESHPYTRSIVRGLRESIQKLGWAPNGNSTTTTSDSSEDSDRDNNNVNDDYEENVMYMEEQMIDPGIQGNTSSTSSSVSTAIENLKRSQFRFVISLVPDRSLSDALMYTAYIAKVAGGDHPTDITGDGGIDGDGGYYYWWAFDTLNLILAGRTFDKNDPQQLILAKAYNSYGSIVQTSDKESKQYKLFTAQAQQLKQQLYQEHYNQNDITNTATRTTTTTTSNTNTMTKKNDRWLFTTPNIPYLDENDWFRNEESLQFDAAAYAYDATILIGMSVCREVAAKKAAALAVNDYAAIGNNTHLHLTGEEIYERIKVTNFTGVSGYVLLDPTTGSRNGDTVRYVIQNSRAFEVRANNGTATGNITFRETVTDLYRPGGDYNWENIAPFIYVNGEKTLPLNAGIPPLQLKQEGINPLTQVVGLTLFGVLMTATIGFAIWTCKHRATKVVRASQPFFLYLLCIGIGTLACAIIPMTYDHLSTNYCDLACNSSFWLLVIGFGITFSALFAKTLRINIIMRNAKLCRRIKLTVRDTLYPVVIIFIFNIIMLSCMLVYKPITYLTIQNDPDRFGRPTVEYGRCCYKDSLHFIIPLLLVNLGMIGLAIFQAWKARNLSTEFAESKYVAMALSITLIATILTVPILVVVKDQPDAATFISTALIFVLTSSTLGSIFIPKIIYHLERTSFSSPDFTSNGSRIGASSTSSTSSIDRFSMGGGGERILTTKNQQTLTKEIKALERELAAAKKRERILQQHNNELEKRQRETSNDDTVWGQEEECCSGDLHNVSEKIKRKNNDNDNVISENDTRNKPSKSVSFSIENDSSSSQITNGSLKVVSSGSSKSVSFCDDLIMINATDMRSSRRSKLPRRNTGFFSNIKNRNKAKSNGTSGELSQSEPKLLMNMVDELHSSSMKDHKKTLLDLKDEQNISDLSLGV